MLDLINKTREVEESVGKKLLSFDDVAKYVGADVSDIQELVDGGYLIPVGRFIKSVDIAKFELGITIDSVQKITQHCIDKSLTSTLPSTNSVVEEIIVTEEEYKMGQALGGSVFYNNTRGCWQAAFYMVEGAVKKRKIITGVDESDARAKMIAIVGIGSGTSLMSNVAEPQKHLFTECLGVAISTLKKDVTVGTAEDYDTCAKYLYRDLQGIYIEDLKYKEVQKFCDNLRSFKGETLSKSVCHKIRIVMRRTFLYGMSEGYITTDPLKFVKFTYNKPKDSREKAIEKGVLKKIMIGVKRNNLLNPIISTLIKSGLRIGELLVLTYSDLDFENNTITVDEGYKRLYKGQLENVSDEKLAEIIMSGKRHAIGEPKNLQSVRVIAVDEQLMLMFKDLKKLADLKGRGNADSLIFGKANGELRSYGSLRDKLRELCKENGLQGEKITFHRFRHSYITYMDAAGVDSVVRKSMSGHLNGNVHDDVYIKVALERKQDAVKKYTEYMQDVFDV